MAESDGGELGAGAGQGSSLADKSGGLRCTFSAAGHSAALLRGLAALRAQGQLLDVVLMVNDEPFPVHKATLAACSDYFRAMFTGGMREASQDVIELKGLSAKGLKRIVDFAYSAEVTLDLDCIQDVLGAAVFLQMEPVVELCQEFLKSAMSVETCLNIGQMATAFSLGSLKESVDAFTFAHFLQISEQEDFLQLPLERLTFFLRSNQLKACGEINLFRAAVRWLQHDSARARESAGVLLGHIRFPLMSPAELVDGVQSVPVMVEDPACRRYLLEAFNYRLLPFRQHQLQSPRTGIRSDAVSLAAFGGTPYTDNDRAVSGRVFALTVDTASSSSSSSSSSSATSASSSSSSSSSRQFRELPPMETGCSHVCVAVLDNFVYVTGGQRLQYRSGEGAVDSCSRYDPHLNQWLRLRPLNEARIQFQLDAVEGRLYATGGRNRTGSLASVECYSPGRDEWSQVRPLVRRTWGHASTPLGGRLYLSGGYGVTAEDKRAVYCYLPADDAWQCRSPMNEPRVLHCMASAKGRVYALGGRMDHADRCFDVLHTEYYLPENDQWTSVCPMRAGQSEAGCCALGGRIYVLGGYNWHLNNVTSIVQVYSVEGDEWERDLHFPESFAGVACAPVVLPQR